MDIYQRTLKRKSTTSYPKIKIGILLDAAAKSGKDVSSLKRGLVSGAALPGSLRQELCKRGLENLERFSWEKTDQVDALRKAVG